ncbi:hypothetical protein Spb1_24520 [Planctopirus ephydatiae]|uniref:Immunity MXAN-0049 protein domain-containing protein n=1 Tax=Planctopirus ephydatiae TaxID=2528019 RepID=A0A518GPH2_9PLAN|nr:DUF1629 domain-containing protein [Planctopirus ephydatiae]QDV30518.1 hypothetical protein Spb1_24520 [Planctopirus ephydatiae]
MKIYELSPKVTKGSPIIDLLSPLNDNLPPNEVNWKVVAELAPPHLWTPGQVYCDDKRIEQCDLIGGTGHVIISKRMLDWMNQLSDNAFIGLPEKVNDFDTYNYICNKCIDALDKGRSDIVYFSTGRILNVHKYAFLPHKIPACSIFQLHGLRGALFATEAARQFLLKSGINNAQFDLVADNVVPAEGE